VEYRVDRGRGSSKAVSSKTNYRILILKKTLFFHIHLLMMSAELSCSTTISAHHPCQKKKKKGVCTHLHVTERCCTLV